MSTGFIDLLRAFNRKERYHLLRFVMGTPFSLGDEFRKRLNQALKPTAVVVPESVDFVAMDYHLDWLQVCMELHKRNIGGADLAKLAKSKEQFDNYLPDGKEVIAGNQEDMDLVVAFRDVNDSSVTHLILCEAKADTGWTTDQVNSKAVRLGQIFGLDNLEDPSIRPHLLLIGPTREIPNFAANAVRSWPAWFFSGNRKDVQSLAHIRLTFDGALYQPTRRDKSEGHYNSWIIKKTTSLASDIEE